MAELARRGVMLVLASPSGAGKSSISRAMFARGPEHLALGLGDDAAAPHRRDRRRRTTTSSTCPSFETHARRRRTARKRRGARQFLRHAARARRRAAGRQGRDILFDIDWQGTLQLLEDGARRHGDDLHPAALDPRAAQAAGAAGAGQQGASSTSGCATPASRWSTGPNTTTSSSTDDLDRSASQTVRADPRRGAADSATRLQGADRRSSSGLQKQIDSWIAGERA